MDEEGKKIIKKGCLSAIIAIFFIFAILFILSGIYKDTTADNLCNAISNFFY